jgi:hypothetical protein
MRRARFMLGQKVVDRRAITASGATGKDKIPYCWLQLWRRLLAKIALAT